MIRIYKDMNISALSLNGAKARLLTIQKVFIGLKKNTFESVLVVALLE